MTGAALGVLVEQWVWRCQLVVTDYQLGRSIDFKGEVDKLATQAEKQARLLQGDGLVMMVKVEDRLITSAHMAEGRGIAPSGTGDSNNVAGRVDALHAIAGAFGRVIERLKPAAA
jgi:hypothetical protein